jgi:hypothetical protein
MDKLRRALGGDEDEEEQGLASQVITIKCFDNF